MKRESGPVALRFSCREPSTHDPNGCAADCHEKADPGGDERDQGHLHFGPEIRQQPWEIVHDAFSRSLRWGLRAAQEIASRNPIPRTRIAEAGRTQELDNPPLVCHDRAGFVNEILGAIN